MKKVLMFAMLFALAMSAFATPTPQAASVLEKQNSLIAESKSVRAEFTQLTAEDKQLQQRNENLSWGFEQFKKQVDVYKRAFDAHNAAVAQYESFTANHNARCTGTFSDRNYVAACNAEADRGDAERARLRSETQSLIVTRNQLREIEKTTTDETMKVFQRRKAINARQNELSARFEQIKAEYNAIQAQVSNCKAQLGSTNTDKAHDVCGEMFDGNKTPTRHTPGPNGQ